MRQLLACALAASLTLAPSQAHANGIDDLFNGFVLVILVSAAVVGTASTLTAVATYKNYRSSSRHEEASGGWVGVGFVGGLAFTGLGVGSFTDGLPSTSTSSCSNAKTSSEPERYQPTTNPEICTYREPANTSRLVGSSLVIGLGALALGYSIKAAVTDERAPAGTVAPGSAPASYIGLTLPPIQF